MAALLTLVLAQDVEELIRSLDTDPSAAERILALGEAAREPLKRAGRTRLLEQVELTQRHPGIEGLAHRLWFGTEEEARELLEQVGGLAERGDGFGPSGAKAPLGPPELNPFLRDLLRRFRSGPVPRIGVRLATTHRIDALEPDVLALLPTDDAPLFKRIVEALGFIGTSRAAAVMRPHVRSRDADMRAAAHRFLRRVLPPEARPDLVACLTDEPEALAGAALETLVRYDDPAPVIAAIGAPDSTVRRGAIKAAAAMRARDAAGPLRKALEDADPECRAQAAQALTALRGNEAIPALAAALKRDQPPAVRTALASALLELDAEGQLDFVLGLSRDPEPSVRRNLLISLGRVRTPGATAVLLAGLKDADAWTRSIAAEGLVRRDTPDVRRALAEALGDPEAEVVEKVLTALHSIGAPEAVPQLLKLLESGGPGVRDRAGAALRDAVGPADLPRVVAALETVRAPESRAYLFAAMLRLGAPIGDEALVEALKDESPGIRLQALDLAFRNNSPLVEPLLNDPHPKVRARAIRAVALLGRSSLAAEIEKMLVHEEPEVRGAAVEALDILDARERVEAIRPLLKDRDPQVKGQARRAFAALGGTAEDSGDPDAVAPDDKVAALGRIRRSGNRGQLPVVRRFCADPHPFVRRAAVETLGEMKDEEGYDVLEPRLEDADIGVRAAAILAAARIDPDRAADAVAAGLDHAAEAVRQSSVRALRELVPARAEPLLLRSLGIPSLRAAAIESIGRLGLDGQAGRVIDALEDRAASVREAAVRALGSLGARDRAGTIAAALGDPQPQVRAAAVETLAALDAADTAPQIRDLLRDPTERALIPAMLALQKFRDVESVPLLRRLLDAPDPSAAGQAALVLLDLGGLEEIGLVIGTLHDRTPDWQMTILARLGTVEAPELAPALERLMRAPANPRRAELAALSGRAALQELEPVLSDLLDDPSFVVREAALTALGRLTPSEKTRERLARPQEDPLLALRAGAALAAAGDPRAVAILRERLGKVGRYRRRVSSGKTLGEESAPTFDEGSVAEAETAAMTRLNALRRRASWLALSERRLDPVIAPAATCFPDFALQWPEGIEADPNLRLDALAPARRTSRQALFLLPMTPVVEAETIRLLARPEALAFWMEWVRQQP